MPGGGAIIVTLCGDSRIAGDKISGVCVGKISYAESSKASRWNGGLVINHGAGGEKEQDFQVRLALCPPVNQSASQPVNFGCDISELGTQGTQGTLANSTFSKQTKPPGVPPFRDLLTRGQTHPLSAQGAQCYAVKNGRVTGPVRECRLPCPEDRVTTKIHKTGSP